MCERKEKQEMTKPAMVSSARMASIHMFLLMVLLPSSAFASYVKQSDGTYGGIVNQEEYEVTRRQMADHAGGVRHPYQAEAAAADAANDTRLVAAGEKKYGVGARIFLVNHLKFPLLRGSATADEGEFLWEPKQKPLELPGGSAIMLVAKGTGDTGSDSPSGGNIQFRLPAMNGNYLKPTVHFMWRIPWSFVAKSAYMAAGVRNRVDAISDENAFYQMFNKEKPWFNRTSSSRAIYRHGNILVIASTTKPREYWQQITVNVVSVDPSLNFDYEAFYNGYSSDSGDGSDGGQNGKAGKNYGRRGLGSSVGPVVWGVILFFALGLTCILCLKLGTAAKKKFYWRLKKDGGGNSKNGGGGGGGDGVSDDSGNVEGEGEEEEQVDSGGKSQMAANGRCFSTFTLESEEDTFARMVKDAPVPPPYNYEELPNSPPPQPPPGYSKSRVTTQL